MSQPLPVAAIVAALVGVQFARTICRPNCQARGLWQQQHKRLQHARNMNIGRLQLRLQGQATLLDDDLMFASELSPVLGIGADVFPAKGS